MAYICSGCGAEHAYRTARDRCRAGHERGLGTYVPRKQNRVPETKPLTGGSSDYYKIRVCHPVSGGEPYTAECNDIIEVLGMDFAEGNVLKAVWRHALARKGNGKPGSTTKYEAEKIVFFGERMVALSK